jgi:hypothetical protein
MSTTELSASSSDIAGAARADINFLAALAIPEIFLFAFPSFYVTIFVILTSFKNKIERFAIGIPRGFAKTTFVKCLALWYIIFSDRKFILIVAASETKAKAILADIMDMLSAPNIRRVFGHWDTNVEKDDATQKVFYFRGKEMVLWGIGAQTSVRGVNRKHQRPDVMLMDDIQDKEDAANPELAEALLVWMLSTLMKARSPKGCIYIFIGNMYPANSILEKLKDNRQWTSLVVGGILEDGSSLWPELKPIDELLEEYESDSLAGHPEIFASEILNATSTSGASGIDISRVPQCPVWYQGPEPGEGSFILIDPSGGSRAGDDCAIEHYELRDGIPILDEIVSDTFTPLETIKKVIEIGLRRNTKLICSESGAYQGTLLFWFDHWCNEQGITGFTFQPLPPRGQNKNRRIKLGAVRMFKGEVLLHPCIRSRVLSQLNAWNPTKLHNTDGLIDLVGYVEYVQQNYADDMIRKDFEQIVDGSPVSAAHTDDIEMTI